MITEYIIKEEKSIKFCIIVIKPDNLYTCMMLISLPRIDPDSSVYPYSASWRILGRVSCLTGLQQTWQLLRMTTTIATREWRALELTKKKRNGRLAYSLRNIRRKYDAICWYNKYESAHTCIVLVCKLEENYSNYIMKGNSKRISHFCMWSSKYSH